MSDVLGRAVRMRLSTNAIRTIEFHGGLDAFLVKAKASQLDPKILKLKKVIMKNTTVSAEGTPKKAAVKKAAPKKEATAEKKAPAKKPATKKTTTKK